MCGWGGQRSILWNPFSSHLYVGCQDSTERRQQHLPLSSLTGPQLLLSNGHFLFIRGFQWRISIMRESWRYDQSRGQEHLLRPVRWGEETRHPWQQHTDPMIRHGRSGWAYLWESPMAVLFYMSELKAANLGPARGPRDKCASADNWSWRSGPTGWENWLPQCPDLPGYCGTRMHIDTHKIHLKNR